MKVRKSVRKTPKANAISTDILQDTYTVYCADGNDYYGAKDFDRALEFVEDFTALYDEDIDANGNTELPPPLTIYRGNPLAVLDSLGVTKINRVKL